MSTLKYIGAPAAANTDIAYVDYVTAVKAADLSIGAVDTRINNGYSTYADTSYVDAQDALLATKAYIDAGDATVLHLSQKDATNGVAALQSSGKIAPGKFNLPSNQRWPRAFWSPVTYNISDIPVTTETTLYQCPITDPGYAYKIVVWGAVDARTDLNTEYPIVRVRVGSLTGEVIAIGQGLSDIYQTPTGGTYLDDFERTSSTSLGTDWDQHYYDVNGTVVSSSTSVYATPGGHEAEWVHSGASQRFMLARNVNSSFATTSGDDQTTEFQFGAVILDNGTTDANNYMLFRLSSDMSQYIRMDMTAISTVRIMYTTNGPAHESQLGSSVSTTTKAADLVWKGTVVGDTFTLFKNGTQIIQRTSTSPPKGASNRGWGIGVFAGTTGSGQAEPASLKYVSQGSVVTAPNTAPVHILPSGLSSQTVWTGAQTLFVAMARSGSTANLVGTNYKPSLFVSVIPA